ncbi:MAG: anaerobic ribonucleoside-triphosphate reductase, partial [Eubacteriales bacterium]|nr:anaerobic ribonucleoside-triphosphate reductase [Eubacteriales bacterium]
MMYYNEHLDGNMETEDVKVCVMKRSGERVPYDGNKIAAAIIKANNEEGILSERLSDQQIEDIVSGIEKDARNAGRDLSVEEIQDKVEDALMGTGKTKVARLYITYRYKHNEMRKMSNIDQKIAGVVERDNEEVKQENSNKNPTVLSVQRDYMAGEWSRYYTSKYLLPEDIVTAHREGVIHFHDA